MKHAPKIIYAVSTLILASQLYRFITEGFEADQLTIIMLVIVVVSLQTELVNERR